MASTPPTESRRGHGRLDNPTVGHETSDINVRAVIWFVASLVTVAVVVQVVVWLMMGLFAKEEARNDPYVSPLAAPAGQLPPEPRLQTVPHQDLRTFVASEDLELSTYGWVDQKAGIVHIPVERAKALILQQGIPARAGTPNPAEGTHVASSGESSGARNIPAGGPDESTPGAVGAPPIAVPSNAKAGGKGGA
ncbi:MAG TPA: hypothetical protein VFX12_08730 [Vicinamibacterales bacterium]|nr:hypothetical protein [Vicinamibacterales bacterium]